MAEKKESILILKKLSIDTYKEPVIYIRGDCSVGLSEGFEAQTRVRITLRERHLIATVNLVNSDLLSCDQAGLSNYAWDLLHAKEGDFISIRHPKPITSLRYVRAKVYGKTLAPEEINAIITDITASRYSDIEIAAFLVACSGGRLNNDEIIALTTSMVKVGEQISWKSDLVVDKHCVGGLPGNRTTPIIVSIVAAFGLTMPKTSSRSITSPAGTADTMEVLTTVELSIKKMKEVVKKENGCIAWGGSVALSPADDIMILVEKALDIDSEGQLIASVLSKKIAAGSNHVLIDMPVGPTAKIRTQEMANLLKKYFEEIGSALGIKVKVMCTDGTQPVGRGIGPALEARDLVAVLKGAKDAPADLRERALLLAGSILEFSPMVKPGEGIKIATQILDSGQAWKKFEAICETQGGIRHIPIPAYKHAIKAKKSGTVVAFDNRRISRVAKFAGAPRVVTAGVDLNVKLGSKVKKGDPLYTLCAESSGQLEYALNYIKMRKPFITIE